MQDSVEVASPRDVRLGSLFNVRDLGGYTTVDGRAVRWRRVYRAASLHQLTDAGRDDLARLRLATIIDLRRPGERAEGGWPGVLDGIPVHPLPMVPDHWRMPDRDFASATEYLAAAYDGLSRRGRRAVREAFALFARPSSYPLVFFCVAGKDRTGLLAALLLGMLGVDDDQVLDDYELSGDRVVAMVDHLRSAGLLAVGNPMIDQPVEMLRSPREALAGALHALRSEFGDLDEYLSWCGVTAPERAAVRGLLLR